MIKEVALCCSLLLLAGCAEAPPAPTPGQTQGAVVEGDDINATIVGDLEGHRIWKFCDGKNLVYVADAYSGITVAVSPLDMECTK